MTVVHNLVSGSNEEYSPPQNKCLGRFRNPIAIFSAQEYQIILIYLVESEGTVKLVLTRLGSTPRGEDGPLYSGAL